MHTLEPRAAITSPSALSDLLMFWASRCLHYFVSNMSCRSKCTGRAKRDVPTNLSPETPLLFSLSLPAKSTRTSRPLARLTASGRTVSTSIMTTECERELSAFISVCPWARLRWPFVFCCFLQVRTCVTLSNRGKNAIKQQTLMNNVQHLLHRRCR